MVRHRPEGWTQLNDLVVETSGEVDDDGWLQVGGRLQSVGTVLEDRSGVIGTRGALGSGRRRGRRARASILNTGPVSS